MDVSDLYRVEAEAPADAGEPAGLRGSNAAEGLRGSNAAEGLRGPNAVEGLRGPNAAEGLRGPNAVEGLRGPNAAEPGPNAAEGPNPVDLVLHVHVQPAAGRSAVVGRHGTSLKVRVAAAPEGGRANEACAALLADTFGLKAAAVELTGGATSRSKQFRLSGVDLGEFRHQLERAVSGALGGAGPGSGKRPVTKQPGVPK